MNDNLLNKYISGKLTDDELTAVVEWIEADEQNRQYYMSLRKLYDISIWHEPAVKKRHAGLRRVLVELGKAAAVAAVLVGAYFVFKTPQKQVEVAVQSVSVPVGQRAELTLADGTKVWLNSNSKLDFPTDFNGAIRRVELVGEGYFEVAHDADKPFVVVTADYDIKVLGTVFDVFAYSDALFETSLREGSVEIARHNSTERVLMKPSSRVCAAADGTLGVMPIGSDDYFLWRDGVISFDDMSVKDLLNRLAVYYDVKFDIRSGTVAEQRFSGKFRVSDGIEHIVKVLRLKLNFRYHIDGDTYTIS